MKLKLNKMTTKELCQWFGISRSTYSRRKKEKLKELKEYCNYEECYGGIKVKDIFISEYVKPNSNYEETKSHVDEEWDESGLDTKKNVSEKIYAKHKDKLTIAPSTTYSYVLKASNELYGPANDYHIKGEIGNCWYKLCIINSNGERRLLTEEEEERRNKICKKYCGGKKQQKQKQNILDSIDLQYKNGEITKETRDESKSKLDEWRIKYLIEFENSLEEGETLGYGTFKVNDIEIKEGESVF